MYLNVRRDRIASIRKTKQKINRNTNNKQQLTTVLILFVVLGLGYSLLVRIIILIVFFFQFIVCLIIPPVFYRLYTISCNIFVQSTTGKRIYVLSHLLIVLGGLAVEEVNYQKFRSCCCFNRVGWTTSCCG